MLQTMINTLFSADANAVCGTEYGNASLGRATQRHGHRHRSLGTGAGTVDDAVPKLRQGSYLPEWLLERDKRAETAMVTVLAAC